MMTVALILLITFVGLLGPHFITTQQEHKRELFRYLRAGIRFSSFLFALFLAGSTSFVIVGENQAGHKSKIYLGGDIPSGRIIAVNGQKGPQAQLIPPGFHFEPLLNIINNVVLHEIISVPEGNYAYLVAKDGGPLRPDQTYADAFAPEESAEMVNDAAYFLFNGGQKGPQTSVLTPGKYRLNQFLWDVKFDSTTEIPKGFVGVVKSNVHTRVDFGNLKTDKPSSCKQVTTLNLVGGSLAVPLVPTGCIGIWTQALSPGKYCPDSTSKCIN